MFQTIVFMAMMLSPLIRNNDNDNKKIDKYNKEIDKYNKEHSDCGYGLIPNHNNKVGMIISYFPYTTN